MGARAHSESRGIQHTWAGEPEPAAALDVGSAKQGSGSLG